VIEASDSDGRCIHVRTPYENCFFSKWEEEGHQHHGEYQHHDQRGKVSEPRMNDKTLLFDRSSIGKSLMCVNKKATTKLPAPLSCINIFKNHQKSHNFQGRGKMMS
jgi:hypothetical protein